MLHKFVIQNDIFYLLARTTRRILTDFKMNLSIREFYNLLVQEAYDGGSQVEKGRLTLTKNKQSYLRAIEIG